MSRPARRRCRGRPFPAPGLCVVPRQPGSRIRDPARHHRSGCRGGSGGVLGVGGRNPLCGGAPSDWSAHHLRVARRACGCGRGVGAARLTGGHGRIHPVLRGSSGRPVPRSPALPRAARAQTPARARGRKAAPTRSSGSRHLYGGARPPIASPDGPGTRPARNQSTWPSCGRPIGFRDGAAPFAGNRRQGACFPWPS